LPLFLKKSTKKPGTSPGTLIPAARKKDTLARIQLIEYTATKIEEKNVERIEDVLPLSNPQSRYWFNIEGLHDVALLEKLGRHFNIHPLVLEDILNTGHRSKIDNLQDYLFVVFKMLSLDEKTDAIAAEQISLVLGTNFVITFLETPGGVFDPVRERLRHGKGRIRNAGCDYLAYALIDAAIDHHFVVLETLGDKIEQLEENLLAEPSPEQHQKIYRLKRELIFFRKQVWPMRELLSQLIRGESELIDPSIYVFLKDVYDHTIQVIDTIESYRDILSGLLDVHLSTISNRMNEIMKVLTVIATIFIPLTFIAGIYGMNFEFMPELKWRWAYPTLLMILGALAAGMVIWIRRKKWL